MAATGHRNQRREATVDVDRPPPTPVADNGDAFVEWRAEHIVTPLNLYTAYPEETVKELKALASAAEVSGAGELSPFLVVLPIKSRIAFIDVQLLLRARGAAQRKTWTASAHHTSHSLYGSRTTRWASSRFTTDPSTSTSPISPRISGTSSDRRGWRANRAPIGFYQAYAGLTVQDIHALIADSRSQAASAS